MEHLKFKDAKTVPDTVHVYSDKIRYNATPLIIDNGIQL